jgi:ribonuclease-3 family protein
MNGLSYAYIGDAVYELEIREHLISKGMTKINKLHKEAIKYTSAVAQSGAMKQMLDSLTEEELKAYKLGRNSSAKQGKKSASMIDYKIATGLESLVGYLYMKDPDEMKKFVRKIIEVLEVQNAK